VSEKYYYWKYENLYSKEEVNEINNQIDNSINPIAKDIPATDVVKTSDVKIIDSKKIQLLERMLDAVVDSNKKNFGYNIYYEKHMMNYNTYSHKNKGRYDYHLDTTYFNPASDIKLTAIVNLSTEEYEGGDFYIHMGKEFIVPEIKKSGNMIIFPSFFLHKVTPVIKGDRKTLTAWIAGPKFQ
jgi:PKHD-type hydroxylase|tara:strand:- start:588 stop:1136 length:549 start_codon:yes stop_codon:yes gene_type:complete